MLPYCTVAQAQRIAREEGGSGKNWFELTLTEAEAGDIIDGYTVVKKLDKAYDKSTFNKDYFHLQLEKGKNLVGSIIKVGEDITKIYPDFTTPTGGYPDWLTKEIQDGLYELASKAGFDYHYYRTIVLYAGMTEPEDPENDGYYLVGPGVLEGKNIVYVQDVTQQEWEGNQGANEKEKFESKERLYAESYGGAYVVHIKGDTAEANVLFCYATEQAAYWDSTANDVRWTEIEAGKCYHVTFDGEGTGQHGSLRWLLTMEGGEPKEYTEAEFEALLQNGIAFEANKVAAEGFEDTSVKVHGPVVGNGHDYLVSLFSINDEFGEDYRNNIEIIGRPAGRVPDYIDWYDEDEENWIDCYDGYYTWGVVVDGVSVAIIIPDMDDYRDRIIIRTYSSNSGGGSVISVPAQVGYTSNSLYRHTISIYNTDNQPVTIDGHSITINICFCAVNCQAGDDAMGYVLYSDQGKQYPAPDWVLPASGLIKIDSNVYTVSRIQAAYTTAECTERCLKIDYVDGSTMARTSQIVVTDSNQKAFTARDFRSVVNDFLVPNSLIADVKPAIE